MPAYRPTCDSPRVMADQLNDLIKSGSGSRPAIPRHEGSIATDARLLELHTKLKEAE